MVAMRPKGLLQVVIGPRQLRNLVAVKEPGPVTARYLEEVSQGRSERPGGRLVPRHRAQRATQALLHQRPGMVFLVGEDMSHPMYPTIGDTDVRPEGSGLGQASLEERL